jgi:tetratricopeptide (TPR) repeat protein
LISYNANLSPAFRYTLIGEQQVLRGQVQEARRIFEKALNLTPFERAEIDLARVEALTGGWDEARARLRPILAAEPGNFDALCVLAYIEGKLQDFEIAAALSHRALAVHDSSAVRLALSQLHN